jgi:uncharacterized repeat protein (TIGR03806 family)
LILFPFYCFLLALIASTQPSSAQYRPFGIDQRVDNTSVFINLDINSPPAKISASGLFTDTAKQTIAPGFIPYTVNAPLWSDGAYKTRFFALPANAKIQFSRDAPWQFPPHSILIKNFYIEFIKGDSTSRQIVETRFLIKEAQGDGWRGFNYQWNDDASEAALLRESSHLTFFIADKQASDGFTPQRYFFPGPEDCALCHRPAAGFILGPRTAQLNGKFSYENATDNQLRTLNHLGLFSEDIGEDFEHFPRWTNPLDSEAPIEARARSYLATNCSHCHRPNGVDRAPMDLRFDIPTSETRTVDEAPTLGRIDAEPASARIINPGDPANSTLLLRMLSFSSFRMPPLASSVIDEQGTQLLSRWIEGMSPITHIKSEQTQPQYFTLKKNYPNPFNPNTTIEYHLERESPINLSIYDLMGQQVRTLVAKNQKAGQYSIQWDGRNHGGLLVASGVYFYQLRSTQNQQTRRLLFLK